MNAEDYGLTEAQIAQLLMPLQQSRIRQQQGQSHLEAWDVRRWLTRIFGFGGWEDEILSCVLVHEAKWPVQESGRDVPGKHRCTAVYRVTMRLTIKDQWGHVIGRWEDGATGDGVNQASVGDAHDLAMKTALSQALKRCAVNLGDQFGISLYNKGDMSAAIQRTLVNSNGAEAVLDAPVVGGELDERVPDQPPAAQPPRSTGQQQRAATPEQKQQLAILCSQKLGAQDRAKRLAAISERFKRRLTSFDELTFAEAGTAIGELKKHPDFVPPRDEARFEQLRDALHRADLEGPNGVDAIMHQVTEARDAGQITPEDWTALGELAENVARALVGQHPETVGA